VPSLDMERASSRCLSPPPGKIAGIFGDGACGLALRALAVPLLRAEAAVAVDGANRFDPYEISRAARARGETAGRPCRASTSPGRSPATRWKRSCPAGCPRRSPVRRPARPRPRSSRDVRRRRRAVRGGVPRVPELPFRAARARSRGDAGRPRRERGTAGFGGFLRRGTPPCRPSGVLPLPRPNGRSRPSPATGRGGVTWELQGGS